MDSWICEILFAGYRNQSNPICVRGDSSFRFLGADESAHCGVDVFPMQHEVGEEQAASDQGLGAVEANCRVPTANFLPVSRLPEVDGAQLRNREICDRIIPVYDDNDSLNGDGNFVCCAAKALVQLFSLRFVQRAYCLPNRATAGRQRLHGIGYVDYDLRIWKIVLI